MEDLHVKNYLHWGEKNLLVYKNRLIESRIKYILYLCKD